MAALDEERLYFFFSSPEPPISKSLECAHNRFRGANIFLILLVVEFSKHSILKTRYQYSPRPFAMLAGCLASRNVIPNGCNKYHYLLFTNCRFPSPHFVDHVSPSFKC